MKFTHVFVSLCLVLGLATGAFAGYHMGGTWSSTSGSTIVIPESSAAFTLLVTHKDGKQFRLKATWARGLVGTQFTFVNEYGRKVTATIDSQNTNHVKLVVEDRNYLWTRVK